MVMGLVLMSIVTGLSLLGGDVTAASLSRQQQQFLRQWLSKNQNGNQLRVVWQPSAVPDNQPRNQAPPPQPKPRPARRRHVVLKTGYTGAQPEAPAPAPQVHRCKKSLFITEKTLMNNSSYTAKRTNFLDV